MNPFEAILLGIVQGLTEFLPISSSGHLILVPWLLDINYLEQHPAFNKTFDVALHLGTLIGVVGYFRTEVREMIGGAIGLAVRRNTKDHSQRLALALIIGTVPAVIAGALGEKYIDSHLGEPWQIAIFLVVFGLLLGWADRRPGHKEIESIGPKEALKIGFAQMLALMPGVSRSGITITAGRWLGLGRDGAARFSFLLLVPATFGAVVWKGIGVVRDGLPAGSVEPMVLGVLASAVSGYLVIAWLLTYVRRHNYDIFVIYRLVAAGLIFALIATGVRSATF